MTLILTCFYTDFTIVVNEDTLKSLTNKYTKILTVSHS